MAIIFNLSYFMLVTRHQIIIDPHNPRLYVYDNEIKRGDILDANFNVIAGSKEKGDGYARDYYYGRSTCHLTGYTARGRAGIEAAYNFELQRLHNQVWQRIRQLGEGSELIGNSIRLTVDMDIQQEAFKQLGNKKGAIVVLEPDTGKILAMVSYPDFDPNYIVESWGELNENQDAPLLNRASQGLYTPGSVFKIISALAVIENDADYKSIQFECTGSQAFGNKTIHCFDGKSHGSVDLYDAMAYSCNTFFSDKIYALGGEKLREAAESRLFNKELYFPLEHTKSVFQLSDNPTDSQLVETGIGQGRTLVSPLYMALLTGAVANNGVMMRPYVVDSFITYNGKTTGKNMPKMIESVFTPDVSAELKEMMRQVVKKGTGAAADIEGVYVAGKTGTAENPGGTAHSWFTSFAEADGKKAVVTVVLENPLEGQSAVPVAKEVIKRIFR